MSTDTGLGAPPDLLRLADLRPYLVITVLECFDDDPYRAFIILRQFLRGLVDDPGRSLSVRVSSEITIGGGTGTGSVDGTALLEAHGFDRLYGVTRERVVRPEWVTNDSPVVDIINELVLALRRGRLVAVRTHNKRALLKWVNSGAAPYRRIPVDVMAATFDGDGKALWLNGVHRRRVTKPDGKALYGLRLQGDNVLEDATYAMSAMSAMSAMKLHVVPEDPRAILRGDLTVSPPESRLAFKPMSSFPMLLAAAAEALEMLEKTLSSESPLDAPFSDLAIRVTDLSEVRGAYDIRVADPDEVANLPDADEDDVKRAHLLRETLLDVTGDLSSPISSWTSGWAAR